MFGSPKDLAVLESKFEIYENLSKEMLDKLERAVTTISDNSNRISLILERHEARLDQSDKTDEALLKLIDKIEKKIDNVEDRVNKLSRFRWVTVGVVAATMILFRMPDIFSFVKTPLTTAGESAMMDAGKMYLNELPGHPIHQSDILSS